jgi:hypothetical protein
MYSETPRRCIHRTASTLTPGTGGSSVRGRYVGACLCADRHANCRPWARRPRTSGGAGRSAPDRVTAVP